MEPPRVTYLTALPRAKNKARELSQERQRPSCCVTTFFQDSAGERLSTHDSRNVFLRQRRARLRFHRSIPWSWHLGEPVQLSPRTARGSKLASRILAGADLRDPYVGNFFFLLLQATMCDWRQIQRWGLSESACLRACETHTSVIQRHGNNIAGR